MKHCINKNNSFSNQLITTKKYWLLVFIIYAIKFKAMMVVPSNKKKEKEKGNDGCCLVGDNMYISNFEYQG